MPALTAPQLALLRGQFHRSTFYLYPVVSETIFTARINDAGIGVGALTITYDGAVGAWGNIVGGQTLYVGTAAGAYNVARIRVRSATSAHIVVAQNSDVSWADNQYLTVKKEYLVWSVRPRIVAGVVFKDYDIAYTNQTRTTGWGPVARMGDPAIALDPGDGATVYFSGASSYAVAVGATIVSYAWNFDDGSTSTAMTPGFHNYTTPGLRWPSLTVTDSNGHTHTTRRPVVTTLRENCYTAFECESIEGTVDGGWTGRFTVRGVSDTSLFPERAPFFCFSDDLYQSSDGASAWPDCRNNIVLFGYIQEQSVVLNPETSEVSFTVESLAEQMAKTGPFPTFVGDATTPADWDEAANLTIFRSMVYLLKFHSTVMEVADVQLYNSTVRIKYSDFPEDNLWNMTLQFAKGRRLLRASVTHNGRLVVGLDPNLLPTASRPGVVTVCQLTADDWREQVTAPQRDFPLTSFLCLTGASYSGVPADDPQPLFGMSPGHPPKEYGAPRELTSLALADQGDANQLAGLVVGQDNNAYGDVAIPMNGNWSHVFEPAFQEYVRAPAAGFPTKRGTLLLNQYLIVRKVSLAFEWAAGVMRPTLTCEAYSYPEVSTIGDCFTPDMPQQPPPCPDCPTTPQQPPPADIDPPYFCYNFSYCDSGAEVIEVDWCFTDNTEYDNYVTAFLYRSTAGPTSGFALVYTDGLQNYYYSDLDVTPGETYWYKVQANVGGSLTPFSEVAEVTAGLDCPVTVTANACTPSNLDVTLSWEDITGATGYKVYRATSSGGSYSLIGTTGSSPYVDAGLPEQTTYYYKVRPYNAIVDGNLSAYVSAMTCCAQSAWHDHLIYATTAKVYEWTDFGGYGYDTTPNDITGNITGTILSFRYTAGGLVVVMSENGVWVRTGTTTWVGGLSADDWAALSGIWSASWFNEDGTGAHGHAWWGCRGVCTTGPYPCDVAHIGDNDPKIHWSYSISNNWWTTIGDYAVETNWKNTGFDDCSTQANGVWKTALASGLPLALSIADGTPPDVLPAGLTAINMAPHFSPYAVEDFHDFVLGYGFASNSLAFDGVDISTGPSNSTPVHYTDSNGDTWAWGAYGIIDNYYLYRGGGAGFSVKLSVALPGTRFALNAPPGTDVRRAVTGTQMWKTTDNGDNWTQYTAPADSVGIYTGDGELDRLYVVDGSGNLWLSEDEGAHWCLRFTNPGGTASVGIWADTAS